MKTFEELTRGAVVACPLCKGKVATEEVSISSTSGLSPVFSGGGLTGFRQGSPRAVHVEMRCPCGVEIEFKFEWFPAEETDEKSSLPLLRPEMSNDSG